MLHPPQLHLRIPCNLQSTLECIFNCSFHISPNYHIIFPAQSTSKRLGRFPNFPLFSPPNVLILCDRRRINHKNSTEGKKEEEWQGVAGGGREEESRHTWSHFTIDKYKFHIRKSKRKYFSLDNIAKWVATELICGLRSAVPSPLSSLPVYSSTFLNIFSSLFLMFACRADAK